MSESLIAHEKHGPTGEESKATPLWLTALADLVVRNYEHTMRSGRVIRPYSHPDPAMHAFTQRDFDAMSLTSLALLRAGQVDVAAEIHELLTACMLPAGQWCGDAVGAALHDLVLVDPDLLVPTEDCQTLAGEFGASLSDTLERSIYKQFREELGLDSTSDDPDMSS